MKIPEIRLKMVTVQIFIYLQLLDLITTIAGFRVGAAEASPFIAKLVHFSSPVYGVVAAKVLALAIGGLCFVTRRSRIVGWANYWYAGLVVWNLLIIMICTKNLPVR